MEDNTEPREVPEPVDLTWLWDRVDAGEISPAVAREIEKEQEDE